MKGSVAIQISGDLFIRLINHLEKNHIGSDPTLVIEEAIEVWMTESNNKSATLNKTKENVRSDTSNETLVLAIAELKGIEFEEAKNWVESKTMEEISGLQNHPRVKNLMKRISVVRAAEAIVDAEMDRLDRLLD